MLVYFLTLVLDPNSVFVLGVGRGDYKASGHWNHTADAKPSSSLTNSEDLGKWAHEPPFLICIYHGNNKSKDLTVLLGELNELLYLTH